MNKLTKPFFSMLLTFSLLLTCLPLPGFAKYSSYPLWIDGVQVNDANRDNILSGDADNDGKISFTPGENGAFGILTLKGVKLRGERIAKHDTPDGSTDKMVAAIYSKIPLQIVVEGNNVIESKPALDNNHGIWVYNADLMITGEGDLKITTKLAHISNYAIKADGNLHIKNKSLTAAAGLGGIGESYGIYNDSYGKNMIIENCSLVAQSYRGKRGTTAIKAGGSLTIKNSHVTATGTQSQDLKEWTSGLYVKNKLAIENSDLIASGESKAFKNNPNLVLSSEQTVKVSKNKDGVGSVPWDNSTLLGGADSPFQYVHIALPPTYQISFQLNDGSADASPAIQQTNKEGRLTSLPQNPKRTGYLFKGWFTNKEGSGQEVTTATVFKKDTVLYAKWEKVVAANNGHEITFNPNYPGAPAIANAKVDDKGKLSALPQPAERKGYEFKGWFLTSDGQGTPITPDHVFDKPLTLYAKWEAKSGGENPPSQKTKVKMIINSPVYFVNGQSKTMDTAPIIRSSRTFVPYRALSESFGAEVIWDGAARSVTAIFDGKTFVMTIGSKHYSVNGVSKTMDVAPFINADNRTMIPLRFAGNALGFKVNALYHADGTTAAVEFEN